jgi:DNA-nicking Smr family endonuclease
MSEPRRRRRALGKEEAALWRQVVATIDPLPGKAMPDVAEPPAPPPPPEPVRETRPLAAAKSPAKPKPPPLAPLEERTRQRLSRGRLDVDARIDLHGMRQEQAHRRLLAFLDSARAEGAKIVLVITGKGKPAAEPDDFGFSDRPGILRRAVPLWLADPGLRSVVLGFEEAGPTHGGSGALYVRLRKGRRG